MNKAYFFFFCHHYRKMPLLLRGGEKKVAFSSKKNFLRRPTHASGQAYPKGPGLRGQVK